MDMRLTQGDAALQDKARRFADEVLRPLELECEEHDGLTPESAAAAKRAVLDWEFHAINHAEADTCWRCLAQVHPAAQGSPAPSAQTASA